MKQLKMKQKNKKEDLLETLGAGKLGNTLAGKRVIRTGKGVIRAGQNL